jgi:hypothetical protein
MYHRLAKLELRHFRSVASNIWSWITEYRTLYPWSILIPLPFSLAFRVYTLSLQNGSSSEDDQKPDEEGKEEGTEESAGQ